MSILVLTSDTLSSPAAVGQIEYSSPIYAATPIGTQRGIIPTQQYYRLNSTVAGADSTSAQSIFGVGVTLSASTVYEFEIIFALSKTAGATSRRLTNPCNAPQRRAWDSNPQPLSGHLISSQRDTLYSSCLRRFFWSAQRLLTLKPDAPSATPADSSVTTSVRTVSWSASSAGL